MPTSRFTEARASKHHWRDAANCRAFFDELARAKRFDPLDAKNWYAVPLADVVSRKVGAHQQAQMRGCLGLIVAFPSGRIQHRAHARRIAQGAAICLSQSGVHEVGSRYGAAYLMIPNASLPLAEPIRESKWKNGPTCREFFDHYAQTQGFDPLNPESWYAVNLQNMHRVKVSREPAGETLGQRVCFAQDGLAIQTQNGGFKKALLRAYPEVDFSRWRKSASRSPPKVASVRL